LDADSWSCDVASTVVYQLCSKLDQGLPEAVSHNCKEKNRPYDSLYKGCELSTPGNSPNLAGQSFDFEVGSVLSQVWTK